LRKAIISPSLLAKKKRKKKKKKKNLELSSYRPTSLKSILARTMEKKLYLHKQTCIWKPKISYHQHREASHGTAQKTSESLCLARRLGIAVTEEKQ
jgi:hypothetical protein